MPLGCGEWPLLGSPLWGVQRGFSVSFSPLPGFQACGVDYEVKAFCAENLEEKIHKR